MDLQVIGAGFGRTGTKSLKTALEHLGYPCYHMSEYDENPHHQQLWSNCKVTNSVSPILQDLKNYKAAVDWPAVYFLEKFLVAFPKAKVVLTYRDFESWWRSMENSIFSKDVGDARRREANFTFTLIEMDTFNDKTNDKEYCRDIYNKHIQHVFDIVPSERLLIFDINLGWKPLCEFLGKDIPDISFPNINSSHEFKELWLAEQAQKRCLQYRVSH